MDRNDKNYPPRFVAVKICSSSAIEKILQVIKKKREIQSEKEEQQQSNYCGRPTLSCLLVQHLYFTQRGKN